MHSSESAGAALLLWTVQVLLQSALAELSLRKVQVMLLWWNYHFGQDSSGHASVCSEQFRSCFCEQFRSCFCLLWTVQVMLLWTVQVMLLSALNSSGHASVNSSGHASVCSEQFRSCFCEQFRSCFCLLWTVQVMLLWIVQVMLLWWNCHTWNRSGHTAVVELSHLEQIRSHCCGGIVTEQVRSHCCGGIVTLGTDQVTLLWWNCHWTGQVMLLWWNFYSEQFRSCCCLFWTVQIMLLSVLNSSDHVSVNSSGHGAVVELSHSEQIRSCCGGWIVTEQFRSCCGGWIVTLDSSGPATVCLDWTYPQESGSPAAAALLLLLFYFLFYLKSFHIGNINLILPLSC